MEKGWRVSAHAGLSEGGLISMDLHLYEENN